MIIIIDIPQEYRLIIICAIRSSLSFQILNYQYGAEHEWKGFQMVWFSRLFMM